MVDELPTWISRVMEVFRRIYVDVEASPLGDNYYILKGRNEYLVSGPDSYVELPISAPPLECYSRGGYTQSINRLSIHLKCVSPYGVVEYDILDRLYENGARVPRPVLNLMYKGFETAIGTEYIDGERLGRILITEGVSGGNIGYIYRLIEMVADLHVNSLAVYGFKRVVYDEFLNRLLVRGEQVSKVLKGGGDHLDISSTIESLYRHFKMVLGGKPVKAVYTHGDLHLDQVVIGDDIYITDFNKEPFRDPIPYTEYEPPVRDLACILNSLEYVQNISEGGLDQDIYRALVERYLDYIPKVLVNDTFELELMFWRVERALYEALYEVAMGTGLEDIPLDTILSIYREVVGKG